MSHQEHTPGKGKQGLNCNVTACQKPNSAHYYNTVMRAWYCRDCAERIEYAANRGGNSFYPELKKERDI